MRKGGEERTRSLLKKRREKEERMGRAIIHKNDYDIPFIAIINKTER
jgi:hypothetical protein